MDKQKVAGIDQWYYYLSLEFGLQASLPQGPRCNTIAPKGTWHAAVTLFELFIIFNWTVYFLLLPILSLLSTVSFLSMLSVFPVSLSSLFPHTSLLSKLLSVEKLNQKNFDGWWWHRQQRKYTCIRLSQSWCHPTYGYGLDRSVASFLQRGEHPAEQC